MRTALAHVVEIVRVVGPTSITASYFGRCRCGWETRHCHGSYEAAAVHAEAHLAAQ